MPDGGPDDDHGHLDTPALAQVRTGDARSAIPTRERALALISEDDSDRAAFRAALERNPKGATP